MKLRKVIFAVAVVSLITVSCNEAKKDVVKEETKEQVETTAELVGESTNGLTEVVDSEITESANEVDSTKVMAESIAKKCEGKCSKDGKSCDGSCKA